MHAQVAASSSAVLATAHPSGDNHVLAAAALVVPDRPVEQVASALLQPSVRVRVAMPLVEVSAVLLVAASAAT